MPCSLPIRPCPHLGAAGWRLLVAIGLVGLGPYAGAEEPTAEASRLENPVPYSEASIAEGRKHYLRHCQICHGFDGRALENIDFEAADLTDPERWRFGTSDGELFVNTRDGVAEEMPPFRSQLADEEIWQLVNYLRSIGPAELRRPLVDARAAGDEASADG